MCIRDSAYIFPSIHEHYHQSQVNVLTPNSTLFPLYHKNAKNGAIQIQLDAGDLLFVPPFWMHSVRSESASVSLSVLSPSPVEVSQQYLNSKEIRLPRRNRLEATMYYIQMLAANVITQTAFKKILRTGLARFSYIGNQICDKIVHEPIAFKNPSHQKRLRSTAVRQTRILHQILKQTKSRAIVATVLLNHIEFVIWNKGKLDVPTVLCHLLADS
eukprot:TRINITY_DN11956_c0_g2_i1.p1 TRINITY_DN11956_c0_g2~~TRINITY_DN11956_c0_g2_i1.p1  ORF type:complete len:215 (+),score=12.19 TRINITY_DN11956_c0_g2_i1:48-692(+)